MTKYIYCAKNNLILINFHAILKEIETNCLNELNNFGLVTDFQINLSNRDTKKLIYHHIIHGLCEEVRLTKTNSMKAIVIPSLINDDHEMIKFCNPEDFELFIHNLLRKLQNMLPFVLYQSKEDIFGDEPVDSGSMQDIICIITELCSIKDSKTFTYERMKKFASQFDLEFLSNDYFNCIKTKMLLH